MSSTTWKVGLPLQPFLKSASFDRYGQTQRTVAEPKQLTHMAQAEDLPLGEDCLNYMAKELKPAPRSTAFDIFALISGGLGVLAIILAMCAYRPLWLIQRLRYITSRTSNSSHNLGFVGSVETEPLPPSTIFPHEQHLTRVRILEVLEDMRRARDLRNSETRI
jgi:hypothetical protein